MTILSSILPYVAFMLVAGAIAVTKLLSDAQVDKAREKTRQMELQLEIEKAKK